MIEAFEVRVGAAPDEAPDEALEEAVERVMRERDAAVQAHVGVTLAEVRRVLHLGEGEESIEGAERVMAELDRAERDAAVAREALAERLRLDAEAEAGQRAVRGEPEEGASRGEQAVWVLAARHEAPWFDPMPLWVSIAIDNEQIVGMVQDAASTGMRWRVRTAAGWAVAVSGDWIVRRADGTLAVRHEDQACPMCGGTGGVTDPETCTTTSCACAAGRARAARIVERLSEVIGVLRARRGPEAEDLALAEAIDELRAIREVVRR